MILLSFLSSLLLFGQSDTLAKDTIPVSKNYKLDEIVITSSRIPKPIKDVPVVTRVISREIIKRNSGQTLISLLENEVPGLEFTQTEGVTNNITFQGMGANYILILIDGERIAGETSRSNPDFNRINLENIEKIEIIKGAMSTLYGSGAIAGVINIITKKSTEPLSATAGINFNGEGESKYSLNLGSVIGKFSADGNIVLRKKNKYFIDDYSSGSVKDFEVEGYDNLATDLKLSFNSAKFNASVKGSYYTHERYNEGNATTHDVYEDAGVIFKSQYKPFKTSIFELSYNYDNYTKFDMPLDTKEKDKNYNNEINNVRLNYFYTGLKNNSITTGIEFYGEKLLTYQFSAGGSESAESGALYVKDDYKISEAVSVQGGLRIEGHSEFGTNITPKLSAMYKIGGFTFRAGYAGGFRSPSLKELYTNWSHMNLFTLIGNRNLKPETSNNYSFAAEYNRRNFNIAASVYHNRLKDKISTIWNEGQDTIYYSNVDKATVTGVDVNAKLEMGKNVILRGYYSYVKDLNEASGKNESSVRPHSAVASIEYGFDALKGNYAIILNSKFASGVTYYTLNSYTYQYAEVRNKPYSIFNIGLKGSPYKGVSFYTGVNNIFNYKPKEISFNSYFTKGTTIFFNLSINVESLLKRQDR